MFMSFQPHIYERDRRIARETQPQQRQGTDNNGSLSLSPSSSTHSSIRGGELKRLDSARSGSSSDYNNSSTSGSRLLGARSRRRDDSPGYAGEASGSSGAADLSRTGNSGNGSTGNNSQSNGSSTRTPYRLGKLSLGRSRRNLAADVAAAANGPPSPLRNETTAHQDGGDAAEHGLSPEAGSDYGFPERQTSQSSFASWLSSPLSSKMGMGKGRRRSAASGSEISDSASRTMRAGSGGSIAPPLPTGSEILVRKHSAKRPPILRSASSTSAQNRAAQTRLSHEEVLDSYGSLQAKARGARNDSQPPPASAGVNFDESIFSNNMPHRHQEQGNGQSSNGHTQTLQFSLPHEHDTHSSDQTPTQQYAQSLDENNAEQQALHTYPLPVRLGLVSPSAVEDLRIPADASPFWSQKARARQDADINYVDSDQIASARTALLTDGRPQYNDGYYLVTPPPRRRPKMRHRASSATSQANSVGSNNDPRQTAYPRRQSVSRGRSSKKVPTSLGSTTPANPSSTTTKSETLTAGRDRSVSSTYAMSNGQVPDNAYTNDQASPQAWQIQDYFRSENQRKPGRFGLTEHKMHAYPVSVAPYFLTYGKNTVTAEVMIHTAVNRIMGPTRIPLGDRRPPRRVLDLGCGCGAWVLDMAKLWPDTEFIGLDLVPCQTPFVPTSSDTDEDKDVASRVSWVVANILDGLPFADQSFDFVHTSFVNSGIPEGKWPSVLNDIVRVLVPDGHFELLEVDWTFYGSPFQMYQADYEALLEGRLKDSSEAVAMWEKQRLGKPEEKAQRFAKLAPVMRLPYERRNICLSPTTYLPACLNSMGHLGDAGFGNVRRVPILGQSRLAVASKAAERASLKANGTMHIDTGAPRKPEVVQDFDAFVTHADPARPLPRHHLFVEDMDALRLAILGADILRNSEIKDLLWNDLEHVRKTQPNSSTQWSNFGSFERYVDEWASDLRSRTDVELLLKNTERWDEAAERMDGWMQEERQRKQLRKRRWAEGPTPFAHALSPLPAPPEEENTPQLSAKDPISPTKPNFMALPPTALSNHSAEPTRLSTDVRKSQDVSEQSDEEYHSDGFSELDASPVVDAAEKVASTGQSEPLTLLEKWPIPPTRSSPPIDEASKHEDAPLETIPILGFRNVCAWSFHKTPAALETPRPDRQKSLPDIPDEIPAVLEDGDV